MKLIKLIKEMKPYFTNDKGKLILYGSLIFIRSFSIIIYPILWGQALIALMAKDTRGFIFYILIWAWSSIIINLIIDLPKNLLHNHLNIKFMRTISKDLYSKILKLPAVAFEDHSVGEFVNRVYSDPDQVIALFGDLIRLLARSVTAVLIIVYSVKVSFILTIELFIFMIFIYILSNIYKPKIEKTYELIKEESDNYIKDSNQFLNGIREIKGLGIRKVIEKYSNKNTDNLFKKQLKIYNTESYYYSILDNLFDFLQGLLLVTCGYFFINGHIEFTVFVMFETYLWRINDVIHDFSQFSIKYEKMVVSLKRIDEIINNKLYKDEKFGNTNINQIKGTIEFKNVFFAYPNEEDTLKSLNLKIETGKKIAIVGKSGMGKSTIFNILLRLFPIKKGKVLIDNTAIEDFSEDSLRKHITIIRQEPYLFNKTIKENFEMVDSEITIEKIKELCKKAYIHDYIETLPNQYDTIIGENGINLSGGQKQRLAIARSLVKNSKIILFDEATSALDNESQEYVQKTIDYLSKNHTVIIIAHRLSTIIDADQIVVINNGKAEAIGTHQELIKSNKTYKKLYNPEIIE